MSRPWVKLDAQTHRRLLGRLRTDSERFAYYATIEAGKLAESEGEWADEREYAAAVGLRLAKHLPALVAAGLVERTREGWVRVVDWDLIAPTDPTNAIRQKRWREKHRQDAVTRYVTAGALRNEERRGEEKEEKERADGAAVASGDTSAPPQDGVSEFIRRVGAREDLLGGKP